MNADQAKLELDATTLRPQDASPEALAAMKSDPQLAAWVAERAVFDESVSAAFAPVAMPAGLRDSILQAAAASSTRPRRVAWQRPILIAAAACVMLSAAVFFSSEDKLAGWQTEALAAVIAVEHGESSLDEMKDNLAAIRQSLSASGAVSPQNLPAALAAAQALGCKRMKIGDQPATIICFMLESGKEAHIVVMNSADLSATSSPQFNTQNEWNVATWSDGQQTFLLATTDDVAALKKLMGHA
jgi:hypothetical protein